MLSYLGFISTKSFSEAGLAVALVLTLVGVALHWNQPRHRMSLEELVKDGKVTADEARRQILFYERFAPVATMLGILLLGVVLFDMMG